MICNYKTVTYNWHMRRTYILVDKWSFMPRKDRRLTVFMLVRIICLKEKGQNIGLHLFFKPDASSCWHLCQLQLSVGEILLQGIKSFYFIPDCGHQSSIVLLFRLSNLKEQYLLGVKCIGSLRCGLSTCFTIPCLQ